MAVTIPTVNAMQDRAQAEVTSRDPSLTDFNEGSFLDAVTGAGAVLADETIRLSLAGQARFFFSTASGDALDQLAADRGFPARNLTAAAVGEVEWTKDLPASAYLLPAGTRVSGTAADGTVVVVESTTAVSVAVIDVSVTVPAIAQIGGLASNLAPGFIGTVIDTVPADPAATVANPAAFTGGAEAETDEEYRARLALFFSTVQRGTVAALIFAALLVPGVTIATVDESLVPTDGVVRVYIGDPDANSNAPLIALVVIQIDLFRAAGVQVVVLGASRQEEPVALTITVPLGADTANLSSEIKSNILGYTSALRPGEALRVSELCFRAHDASADVISVLATTPTADVTPTLPQDAIRVNEVDITLTFTEIAV